MGNVDNWVEGFCGTAVATLRRPEEHFYGGYRVETINDANMYIVNFHRSVQRAPDEVAKWADNPVHEADLHARHKWLVRSKEAAEWRKRFTDDPEYFDAKIAGWWCWGCCCWIGSGWCEDRGTNSTQVPELAPDSMRGVTGKAGCNGRPQLADTYDIGRGVNQSDKRVNLAGEYSLGKGVNAASYLGICDARRAWLTDWMRRLSDRLRLVRTCYGHWSRICDSDSTLTRLGITGVFLDPPYPSKKADGSKSRDDSLYATDKNGCLNKLRDEVLAWCRKWGQDPQIRVAVCGYEGDGYEALEPEGWEVVAWEANGGYSNQRRKGAGKSENAKRERIVFSPACLKPVISQGMWDAFDEVD
jgi:hypothetical protein